MPDDGDIVLINTPVTITGNAPNIPGQIRTALADVILDLSLTVGDGTGTTRTIQVNSGSSLTIATGRTITATAPASTQAANIDGTFTIASGATFSATSAATGINSEGSVINNGTITVSGSSIGIFNQNGGGFTNNSEINITAATDGIRTEGGFTNEAGGSIMVTQATNDGIEAINGGTFTNNGSLDITINGSSAADNGIDVATSGSGTFDNTGTVTVDGGTNATVVSISVREMGTLTNTGGDITIIGGDPNQRLRAFDSSVTNGLGGEIDVTNGRITLRSGATFINSGLLVSTLVAGVDASSGTTSTNNGFYSYDGIAVFATGGTVTDNGIDLNDSNETTIDAAGSCTVNIANAAGYEYFDGSTSVGTSGVSGEITLSNLSSTTMVTLTNDLTGVEIIVEDICASALPITLTSFTAKPSGKDVLIEWETATELNNDYMAVERSADGRRFEEIGRVPGAGNSNTPIRYALTDDQPLPGLSYYRLRQVDFDGTTSYSDVRSVNLQSAAGGSIRVYPTVSNGKTPLTLTLPSVGQRGDVALDIFHASGALVHSVRLPLGRQQQLQLPTLSPGTYIIKSRDERLKMAGRFVVLR